MVRKIIFLFVVLLSSVTTLSFPTKVSANTAATSAVLSTPNELLEKADDNRAQILREYLEKRNSPLAPYAKTFINEADKNDLDWRLVASISGLESSFGIHIPAYSFNGWGFGIYGDNVKRFESWDEGISVVSKALREDYMNKWGAENVYDIGKRYAASPTWAVRVQYFINSIDEFEKDKSRTTLALSL